jgi:hypothetical protein
MRRHCLVVFLLLVSSMSTSSLGVVERGRRRVRKIVGQKYELARTKKQ